MNGAWPLQSDLSARVARRAMGALMDAIMFRADAAADAEAEVRASLTRIAPHCAWTSGSWEGLDLKWNEVQATPQHINRLRDHLIALDRELARGPR